jgi:hypothetical protein
LWLLLSEQKQEVWDQRAKAITTTFFTILLFLKSSFGFFVFILNKNKKTNKNRPNKYMSVEYGFYVF